MHKFKVFSRLSKVSTLLLGLTFVFIKSNAQAQIIGPSVQEVKFSYKASFDIPASGDQPTDLDRAEFHATHMFGLFHSPEMVQKFGIPEMTGGIGGPRSQMKIKILSSVTEGELVHIEYKNSGKMILHKKAAQVLLKEGHFEIPLPTNPYNIYDEKCTDKHYTSFGDYWYFYNPFRKGCEYLSNEPFATLVNVEIKPLEYKKIDQTPQLPRLRGDNGNGSLFSIYVIHGFETDTKDKVDSGRQNFKEFNDYLRANHFEENQLKSNSSSSLLVFTKKLTLDNGQKINVEVKHMLVTTSIESRSKLFAQYFKEAIENADVIVYGGHSGLGGNLDIPSLEEKAGDYKFNPNKKQIFFFDSCSSYSYYLQHFAVEKTKAKIDVVTYGLSSYFNTSNDVLTSFMNSLLSKKSDDVLWSDILKKMEKTLEGDTYLLNVGGI